MKLKRPLPSGLFFCIKSPTNPDNIMNGRSLYYPEFLYCEINKPYLFLINGNNTASRIESVSVRTAVRRSIPIPHPAVGGIPYSKVFTKSSSIEWASASPSFFNLDCALNQIGRAHV